MSSQYQARIDFVLGGVGPLLKGSAIPDLPAAEVMALLRSKRIEPAPQAAPKARKRGK